ncbi:glycine cleavage system transcriptional repressor [Govanella unica]|uniref:Amino acid-binding protein n=1 Tax=Govanella unica TaxID=2975056 RepID=A0A9X3Z6R1_9PROT|nr:ACT domain-containing protein [Govania unica]MDA5193189.1 amino acid-binding protein [Govania unica]
MSKSEQVLISIVSPDKLGLIAEVTGELYGLGVNLGDVSFAVLGAGCEFSAMAELPTGVGLAEIEAALRRLPTLQNVDLRVTPLPFSAEHRDTAEITHFIEVVGGDRPGLIALLSQVFGEFEANIVRLNSRRNLEVEAGQRGKYLTVFAVSMPPGRAEACLSAVHNMAGQLNLTCSYRTAG